MVIDVRGKTEQETHDNILKVMELCGYKGVKVVCEKCGEEAHRFKDYHIDKDGYIDTACPMCGGRRKVVS